MLFITKMRHYLAAALLALTLPANAEVFISKAFSTDVFQQEVDIGAGRYWALPLPVGDIGRVFEVQVALGNSVYKDITAFVVDETNFQRFQQHQAFRLQGVQKSIAPFVFRAVIGTPEQHYLVLDNSYALLITKRATVGVKMTGTLDDEAIAQARASLESVYGLLKQRFVFPDFNIHVRPCGQANAFSAPETGDITFCTEIISRAVGKPGLFIGTFAHELGHTLLNIWGLPGSNNEDVADEFATMLLLSTGSGGPGAIQEWLSFFENRNPYAEAENMIQQGDRHSLSIQRIRNIRANVANAADLEKRWDKLLYPHMTDQALRQIAIKPSPYDDAALATTELEKRVRQSVAN